MKKISNFIKKFYVKDPGAGCVCADCGRERNVNAPACEECRSSRRKIFMYCGSTQLDINNIVLTIILGVIILSGIFGYTKSLSLFSEETLFWFFSAVLQAFTALIAFLAAVIIFRLQIISNEENLIIERLRQVLVYFKNEESFGYTQEEVLTIAGSINQQSYPNSKYEAKQVQSLYMRISLLKKSANTVRINLRKSVYSNLTVIFSALAFLALTEYINKYYLDIPTVLFVLLFCFMSLVSAKKMLYLIR